MRRAWHTALALCVAGSAAWGQVGPGANPGDAPSARIQRSLEDAQRSLLDAQTLRALQGTPLSDAEKAAQAVTEAIRKGDCPGAARELNAGLARSYPEVLLLAGAMLEEGICLKPNWERAVGFYERAANAGQSAALARIAAGYAAAAGGRDRAAALWWGLRANTPMPAPCAQPAPLVSDADRFVAALNAWPAGQLDACAYAVAVMATIQAEALSPGLASAYGLEGKLRVSLVAEQGRVEIDESQLAPAPVYGAVADLDARTRSAQASRQAFSTRMRAVADRALKRYDRPAALPANWRADADFVLKEVAR